MAQSQKGQRCRILCAGWHVEAELTGEQKWWVAEQGAEPGSELLTGHKVLHLQTLTLFIFLIMLLCHLQKVVFLSSFSVFCSGGVGT